MPFEVFSIEQPDVTMDHSKSGMRTAEIVASEIQTVYTKVACLGGKVVAEHTIVRGGDRAYGTGDHHWLFLVAEIPEA